MTEFKIYTYIGFFAINPTSRYFFADLLSVYSYYYHYVFKTFNLMKSF